MLKQVETVDFPSHVTLVKVARAGNSAKVQVMTFPFLFTAVIIQFTLRSIFFFECHDFQKPPLHERTYTCMKKLCRYVGT